MAREIAPAKLNLALHVRDKLPDGRHAIETVFAFCTDGDSLSAEQADEISLTVAGPFRHELGDGGDNLVVKAARSLAGIAGVGKGAAMNLDKKLPVGSGIGGGSADAAAALRLLTSLWRIDPKHAETVAPTLGS
ncbi:MAG TPA: 4-(cytidine 5'-diphospho)-2-C-methyl-D-erythritol kinase, partial [Sphingomicrobium sp.]|nr:4-(cytidine 5'-diphospho)-2-C-methyl-D-erythritol kinase [Sphingomicrobium sp.]